MLALDDFSGDAGQIGSVTNAGVTTSYLLNGLGQRVKKTTPSGARYFVYDEAGHVLGSYDATGTLVEELVWLDDIPVAWLLPNGAGTTVYYVHTDHLNTPKKLTRATDNVVVWRWDADAFGTTAPDPNPDGDGTSLSFNLRFPGQYYDAEAGLSYNYFRDYDPQVGRYVESDPIGLKGGLNTYGYVGGNPISFIDPLGLKVEVRCRRVGNLTNPDLRSRVAAGLGGEHCFVAVSCKGKDGTLMPESTISYLGPTFIATNGSPSNNDTAYSASGEYRNISVSPSGSDNDCPSCKFEKCILSKASTLRAAGYVMKGYSMFGPNSNSFARRLVESCGGQVSGDGPLTGWGDAGSVGFWRWLRSWQQH